DKFGNASIQPEGETRDFDLSSTSTGTVTFASPLPGSAPAGNPAVAGARLLSGNYGVDFFLKDTLAGTYNLTVSPQDANLSPASLSYTVGSGEPVSLVFITPERKLIAGTTVQYRVLGVRHADPADDAREAVPTPITLELRDAFGNTASTNTFTDLNLCHSNSPNLHISDLPNTPLDSWKPLGLGCEGDLNIPQNNSQLTFYLWDTRSGTSTIVVDDPRIGARSLNVGNPASQDVYITPNRAVYFTLHHNHKTPDTALSVTERDYVTVRARDLYGNVASGDQTEDKTNGQYYTGTIGMSVNSSSAVVENRDSNPPNQLGTTYYTFTSGDAGVYGAMGVRSEYMTESLRVNVTDYATAHLDDADHGKIYGMTGGNDARLWSVSSVESDPDIMTGGVVIVPTDYSPEEGNTVKHDALSGTDYGSGITKLLQGAGTIKPKFPILMMRFASQVRPFGSGLQARLKDLNVFRSTSTTLAAADVASIGIYVDQAANGLGTFCAPDSDFTSALCDSPDKADILVASATYADYDSALGTAYGQTVGGWKFRALDTRMPTETLLSNNSRNYYLTVRISSSAELATDKRFGLLLPLNNSNIIVSTVTEYSPKVAVNNFPMYTYDSVVTRVAAQVYTLSDPAVNDITPKFWIDGVQYSTVTQSQANVGMLKLQLWTNEFSGKLNYVKVTRLGTGEDSAIKSVRLYLDTDVQGILGDPCQLTASGNGQFDSGQDTQVSSQTVFGGESWAILSVLRKDSCGRVDTSTRTYFVVYEFANSATVDKNHAAAVRAGDIEMTESLNPQFLSIQSAYVTVKPTYDTARVTDRKSLTSLAVQGSTGVVVARMNMSVDNRSVILTGIKLDRWSPSGGLAANYKPNRSG
ncbi:MAG TPA: hypothetical protein PL037_05350, partial [Elusimicrobiales bacterium]|nr:hypothetical protein [Elusimicrobiales bacterium]